MREETTPITAKNIRGGMRLIINACYCLNPSMAKLKERCVPVNVQVLSFVIKGDSVLIEATTCKLFLIPKGVTLSKIKTIFDDTDLLKPQPKEKPEFFNYVSID